MGFPSLDTLTIKRVNLAASASGDTTVVAAVARKQIVVIQQDIIANAAVNVKWKSGASTDITGLYYFAANTGYVKPLSQVGWFVTAQGEALVINLSSAVAVGGVLSYVEV